jgi:pantoate--beta-alanine ligase
VRRARREADVVVVSIFVNPTQFDRREDFDKYPRNDAHDRELLEGERVEVLFQPDASEVYDAAAATTVGVSGLTGTLCGPRRPGHFDGVTTVVASLFNMVLPHFAVFGEKDYQQLQVIRRMTRDMHFPVRIVSAPTVREFDGLAMSSRNARLSEEDRQTAVLLSRGLRAAAEAFAAGQSRSDALAEVVRESLSKTDRIEVEYLEIVDGQTLKPVEMADEGSVIAAAVWLGGVRLIDNVVLARWLAEQASDDDTVGCPGAAHDAGRAGIGVNTDA